MNPQELITNISRELTDLISRLLPGIPAEVIRYGGATLLTAIALLVLVIAIRLLRGGSSPRNTGARQGNIPRTLQQEGVALDILADPASDDVAVRCVITSAKGGKIKCEIIERLDVLRTPEGKTVTCVFAPLKLDGVKVNSFNATLTESDKSGRKSDRIVLSAPSGYTTIPRRRHPRKRVADQQFIRVKLWVADPATSDISFMDAAPHIGVNSFGAEGPDQSANAVVNISGYIKYS